MSEISDAPVPSAQYSDVSSSDSDESTDSQSATDYKYNRRRHRRRRAKREKRRSSALKNLLKRVNILSDMLIKPGGTQNVQNDNSQSMVMTEVGGPDCQNISTEAGGPSFQYFMSGDGDVSTYEIINQNIRAPNIQYVQTEIHAPFEETSNNTVLEVPVAQQEFINPELDHSQNQKPWQGLPHAEGTALVQDSQILCWEPSVQLKEPTIKEADASELDLLTKLQKFNRSDWMNIPFFETQKAHRATPGFCALKTNPELKPFDMSATYQTDFENTLAAITHAAITHSNAVQERLQGIVNWCNSGTNLSTESVTEKIKELFVNDKEFLKTNDDILQLSCGKRAGIIQHRRFNIISQCSNSVVVEKLKEIPPSNTHLFENTQLQKVLIDHGGTNRTFVKPAKTGGFTQKPQNSKPHHYSAANKSSQGYKRKHSHSFRDQVTNRQNRDGPTGHESRKRQRDDRYLPICL